ncbi:hypothetical protein PSYCG_03760 [Psychrobacter sp. G]|nr:hypothetical protein PSYCG_03760 [Psychrobacter sp. G]
MALIGSVIHEQPADIKNNKLNSPVSVELFKNSITTPSMQVYLALMES